MTIMNGPSNRIVKFINNETTRKKFDTYHKRITSEKIQLEDSNDVYQVNEEFQVNIDNDVLPYLDKSVTSIPSVQIKMKTYTYTEDKFSYYIFRKPEGKTWDECFIIIPLINDPDKCLVYFFSNFKSGIHQINEKAVSPFVEHFLDDERMMFLKDLRSFVNKQPMPDLELGRISSATTPMKKTLKNEIVQGHLPTEANFESSHGFKHAPSESSVILFDGETSGIKERFPNYNRTKTGHLWCNDAQILSN
jgi:hypothetical protein